MAVNEKIRIKGYDHAVVGVVKRSGARVSGLISLRR